MGGRRLEGKVAVVTGSASGIGKATVEQMANEGASVVIADINEAGADEVAAAITADGGSAIAVGTDVSLESDVRAMVDAAVSAFGGVDILFNNAGALGLDVLGRDGDVITMDVDVWDKTMAVNVRGVMLGCKYGIPSMLERGGGSVINTSSVSGQMGNPFRIAYGTSKGALIAFTKYVATAYGKQNVRCNNVAPSVVFTPAAKRNLTPESFAIYEDAHCLPRLSEPSDIASVVTFLASDESSFITGQTILVDGGMLAHSPTYPYLDRQRGPEDE